MARSYYATQRLRYAMFGDNENEPIKINESMNETIHLQEPLNRQIAYDRLLATGLLILT